MRASKANNELRGVTNVSNGMNADKKPIGYELDYADASGEELNKNQRRAVRSLWYSVVSLGGPAFNYTLHPRSSLLDEWPYLLIPFASVGFATLGVIGGLWVMVYATSQVKREPVKYGRMQKMGIVAAMIGGVTIAHWVLTPSIR